jgi:LytS/YehU family sensor histidine kinase
LRVEGDTTEQYIAPLLIIVFIENTFKHFSAPKGKTAFIYILLSVKNNKLHLNVKNSIDPEFVPKPSANRKGGLGLDNARKRLNLIYPAQHKLMISKNTDSFETDLIIELI